MNKRIVSIMLAVVLLLGVASCFISAGAASGVLWGDANGDGKLTITDATEIQRHLAKLETLDEASIARSKVSGGEILRIVDATEIQRKLAKLIDRFTVEDNEPTADPTSGEDPTSAPATRTIKVGVISYLIKDWGYDNYYVHYWGGKTNGNAALTYTNTAPINRYVGYWKDSQIFLMFTAEIPADATGFKVMHEPDRWFGEDADTSRYNQAFIFNYDGDKAAYDTFEPIVPPSTEPADDPTEPSSESPTTDPDQPDDEVTKVSNSVTIYFSNNLNWTTVNAYFFNHETGAAKADWPGTAMQYLTTNGGGEKVYTATVDVTKFDRVIFNNGYEQTTNTPVTKASSGYFVDPAKKGKDYSGKYIAGVYPYGQSCEGNVTIVSMDYPDGYKKKVFIWTPEGYDPADTTKKYHVLYMCDGQNLFGHELDPDTGLPTTLSQYEWECDESVLSLMGNGGDGMIVVGVEAGDPASRRDHELTPNLGSTAPGVNTLGNYSNGGGKVFADFVVDTVIPYVEQNYHVSGVRGVAGSSSGGIEAFYIGMEHRDMFRFIGALSPAFILYEESTWNNYLSKMDFSEDTPRIYFFCGNSSQDALEQALYPNAVAMQGWLKNLGYPSDKMTTVTDDEAVHNEGFWAIYFPEMLSWCMDL